MACGLWRCPPAQEYRLLAAVYTAGALAVVVATGPNLSSKLSVETPTD